MKQIYIIAGIIICISCNRQIENATSDIEPNGSQLNKKSAEPVYSIITTEKSGLGWGYQILKDGKLMINQENIPAIQGNKGFSNKEEAEKTAEFMLSKIKNGVFPPTISIEELDSLQVLD